MPLQSWFDRSTREAVEVRDRLTDPASHVSRWFEPEQIADNVDRGRIVNVWLLLVLEEWLCQVRQWNQLTA